MNHYLKIGLYILRFFLVALLTLAVLEFLIEYLLTNEEDSFKWIWGLMGNIGGFVVLVWMLREVKRGYKFVMGDEGIKQDG